MRIRTKQQARRRRHLRIRRKVHGTAECPRMSVFVSKKHFYVQFIDDETSRTLAQASTVGPRSQIGGKHNREIAKALGKAAGERAIEHGITEVVFDRGGFAYGARISALADAAREAGLRF